MSWVQVPSAAPHQRLGLPRRTCMAGGWWDLNHKSLRSRFGGRRARERPQAGSGLRLRAAGTEVPSAAPSAPRSGVFLGRLMGASAPIAGSTGPCSRGIAAEAPMNHKSLRPRFGGRRARERPQAGSGLRGRYAVASAFLASVLWRLMPDEGRRRLRAAGTEVPFSRPTEGGAKARRRCMGGYGHLAPKKLDSTK